VRRAARREGGGEQEVELMATEPSDIRRELRDQVNILSQVGSAGASEEDALAPTPTDVLEAEHDLIRRVIEVLERESARIGDGRDVGPVFIDRIVDFFYIYADRVHHGKEEEILFRALDDKALSPPHRQMMGELVREHVKMRHITEDLIEARDRYIEGDGASLKVVEDAIGRLSVLYPGHFRIEEETFFPETRFYLDDSERRAVLREMRGHDRAMIHEKYGAMVDRLEGVVETWRLNE
jgi:hemerythrin-like domain-containing protein